MSATTTYEYRHLTSASLPLFRDLLRVFGDAFEDVPAYQHAVPTDAYLAELLAKPHIIALAAFNTDDEVIGGLVAYVLDKFEQDRREIYIYDLAVAASNRRQGVATGLINNLRAIAASLDVYVIFVQADLVDAPAIALYESLGTKETALHFDIAVKQTYPRPLTAPA
jgi:aminoglycoside 3-N-acetyltransferase I